MRQYKFRGKRVDNGEWVFGLYVKSANDRAYIIIYATEDAVNTGNEIDFLYIEVIPETVGQSTGLHDKNGKEIYEGDVVEFEHGGRVRAYVIYKDGSFEVKNDKADVLLYLYVIYHKAEVIGNIHDKE